MVTPLEVDLHKHQGPVGLGTGRTRYGVVLRKLGQVEEATTALVRSVSAYPCNWSAWLELIPCCSSSDQVCRQNRSAPERSLTD